MARDPWKRAYELSQSVPPPPPQRAPRSLGWLWALLAVLVIAGAGTAAYLLGYLAMPRSKPAAGDLPAVAKEVLPDRSNSVEIDVAALDSGLGIGLHLYADYLDVLAATRDWNVPWEVKATGGGTLRVTAPGITIFTRQNIVQTFDLDLQQLSAARSAAGDALWAEWLPQLSAAGLIPETPQDRFEGLSPMDGDPDTLYLSGRTSIPLSSGTAQPQYLLRFRSGRLAALKGGQTYSGASTGAVGKDPDNLPAPRPAG